MNKPTWKNTFNSELKYHGWIWVAYEAAQENGYEYFVWNERVYEVETGADTNILESDLTEEKIAEVLKKFGSMQINLASSAAQNAILEAILNANAKTN